MDSPKISVIMSVYNNHEHVGAAIESILCQSYANFEFLITDDGSNDGSSEIIDYWEDRDKRIKVFRQSNSGLTYSLNNMIEKSIGDYIARMDADDISHHLRFQMQVEYLDTHLNCAVVGTGYAVIDRQGRPYGGVMASNNPKKLRKCILILQDNPLCHGSTMIRRIAIKPLDPVYRCYYGQDFDLWIRLIESWDIGVVQSVLYRFRNHEKSLHLNEEVAKNRNKQRNTIVSLRNRGLLFDNIACSQAVEGIYNRTTDCSQKRLIQNNSSQMLSAHFFSGSFNSLYSNEFQKSTNEFPLLKRFALLIIFHLPVPFAHFLYNLFVKCTSISNPVKRRLYISEVVLFS